MNLVFPLKVKSELGPNVILELPPPLIWIISTSCEHFSDKELNNFLSKRKTNTIVVLQNNNYFALPEHKNCKNNLNEFANSLDLHIIDSMELKTDAYTRYMIVGR